MHSCAPLLDFLSNPGWSWTQSSPLGFWVLVLQMYITTASPTCFLSPYHEAGGTQISGSIRITQRASDQCCWPGTGFQVMLLRIFGSRAGEPDLHDSFLVCSSGASSRPALIIPFKTAATSSILLADSKIILLQLLSPYNKTMAVVTLICVYHLSSVDYKFRKDRNFVLFLHCCIPSFSECSWYMMSG